MPTLVLSHRFSDDSNAMWRAAVDAGWEVERIHGFNVRADLAQADPVVYGETLLADVVAEHTGLVLLEPTPDWLVRLPPRFRRRSIRSARLADVRVVSERRFIKPVDEKLFPARVYTPGETIDARRAFDDGAGVLVSEPVRFRVEVRAFVLERRIATLSAYIREGEIARDNRGEWPLDPSEEAAARALLDELLADSEAQVPPATVIDVGLTADRGWVVVEANPCWASGLCGCDPRAVLDVLRRANVRAGAILPSDVKWSRATHTLEPTHDLGS